MMRSNDKHQNDSAELAKVNTDFSKMSLGIRQHQNRMHKSAGLKAATGEIS